MKIGKPIEIPFSMIFWTFQDIEIALEVDRIQNNVNLGNPGWNQGPDSLIQLDL